MKAKILILSLALSMIALSCTKDQENTTTPPLTNEDIAIDSKIDMAIDDLSDIALGVEKDTYLNPATGRAPSPYLPSCATVVRTVSNGHTIPVPGDVITKTITFDPAGCTMPNGNVLKGEIVVSFTFDPLATSHTINYSFNNFYHNDLKLNGSRVLTRTMTGAPSHPIVTININMTVTLPDSRTFIRTGQRIREFVEGFDTPLVISDDVHKITGSWTTTTPALVSHVATISNSNPLLVKMSCMSTQNALTSQGLITFVRNGNISTLDFGDGTCDNTAVLTRNGVSITITLRH